MESAEMSHPLGKAGIYPTKNLVRKKERRRKGEKNPNKKKKKKE